MDSPIADEAVIATARRNAPLGMAMRVLAMFVLALMFAGVKMAADRGVHVVESLFWRQAMGVPIILLWLKLQGALGDIRTRSPMAHAVRMMLGVSAMGLNFMAMILLPMAEASTIGFAVPMFATILAALLLKEPTGPWRWCAVLLGLIGVIVVIQPTSFHYDLTGSLVAIIAAIMTASVTIQVRRMAHAEPVGAIVFWFSVTSLVPLGLAMPFFASAHDGETWGIVALLSLAGAFGQILLTLSLRHAPVAAALTMDYTSLIWSVILGIYLFGTWPEDTTWIGAGIVISAGMIILWREARQARKPDIPAP